MRASVVCGQLFGSRHRIAEGGLTADTAMVYAGAAQILRRVGAHVGSIASMVVQPCDKIRHGDD